jgi:hypothetical protein
MKYNHRKGGDEEAMPSTGGIPQLKLEYVGREER